MLWAFTNLLLQYLHIAKNVQTREERTDSYILCRTVYVVLLHTGSEGAVEAVEVWSQQVRSGEEWALQIVI